MTKEREIIRLSSIGLSQREIAASCRCSRNTVSIVLRRAKEEEITWPLSIDEGQLRDILFPEKNSEQIARKQPDFETIHKELSKSGVNLRLLWHEYCDQCSTNNEMPLMYSQFTARYRQFTQKTKASMHIYHKPGDVMEVDWAGTKGMVLDRDTGEIKDAHLFVAVLPCSKYTYVEAFPNETMESWITAHVHAFSFFGGVPRIVTPDNLRTGVATPSPFDPVINKTYNEMAEHYGTVIMPARVRKPKDKSTVENSVSIATTWILAALRNQRFFSFNDFNRAIHERLQEYNDRPFQKIPGSRSSIFLGEEKAYLQQLPGSLYELATWKTATVQFNYHISVDGMHYSVPYEYIRYIVDIRITSKIIEVFYHHTRICSHRRLYGRQNQYSTTTDHMPADHQKYQEWNAERFLAWAQKIGTNTRIAIQAILESRKVEQQAYKSCMGLLKLAERYSQERLEKASYKALQITASPSYKNIESILKTGRDKLAPESESSILPNHQNIRGAGYYSRGGN